MIIRKGQLLQIEYVDTELFIINNSIYDAELIEGKESYIILHTDRKVKPKWKITLTDVKLVGIEITDNITELNNMNSMEGSAYRLVHSYKYDNKGDLALLSKKDAVRTARFKQRKAIHKHCYGGKY